MLESQTNATVAREKKEIEPQAIRFENLQYDASAKCAFALGSTKIIFVKFSCPVLDRMRYGVMFDGQFIDRLPEKIHVTWQEAKVLLEDAPIEIVELTQTTRLSLRSRGNDYVTEIPRSDLEWFDKTLDRRRKDDPKIEHVVD